METLYQISSSTGNTKVWSVEVRPAGETAELVIRSGVLGGKMVENVRQVEGKNIGRSNETTPLEQAQLEAQSKINEKLRKGYVSDVSEVKSSAVLGTGIPAPMLAHKYHPTGAQSGSKTLSQIGILGKEICVQPKLDGNRCLIVVDGYRAEMYTRTGKLMPVQLKHILHDVLDRLHGTKFILDGELYSDEISFNTLNGLIKREMVTSEQYQQRSLIKYHLYDVISHADYRERYDFICQFASENIHVIPSEIITATDKNIQEKLELYLSQGHEGLMIRQLGMGYDNKRSWQLCKYKVFEDAEYKLVGFEEDARGGFVGAFVMQNGNGTFNAGASGQSVEERTEMWKNPQKYIGRMATIEYFGKSEYGVPRFPKFKGIR